MESALKTAAVAACRWALRPIVRMLLKHGVMHKEFVQLSKEVYVELARKDYGLRGRPTNVSRTALLTGLDRKEVGRIKDVIEASSHDAMSMHRQDRISRVLRAWHLDPKFLDGAGRPLPLSVDGPEQSFEDIVRRYSGDVPAITILRELKRVGAVEEVPDGRLRVLRRNYRLDTAEPEALTRAGSVIEDLGMTVTHNLYHEENAASRFEARAFNSRIPQTALPAYRKFIYREGQTFLERVDAWLTEHELKTDDKDGLRLGLGMYWIQN
ncbi:MAG: DUF6502 family protein [Gammaproteobacteria bacterium]|nr:DUF6502 family protein [Gammaproteobacteria bacterium]